ncbi:glycerophosphodiester phosphodiesterase [Streptomyces sp. NPDC006879]|uniref:glycerophosphodiester phosphodiesterase n=1 Tax=Streptomyces sp. NPDC006879 TaxID=3364767 RepID=UPI0036BDFFD0
MYVRSVSVTAAVLLGLTCPAAIAPQGTFTPKAVLQRHAGAPDASSGKGRVTEPGPQARRSGQPTLYAHRGAVDVAPENTLAAVDAAARQGTRWVENDVQRTRDGELVIIHDTTLSRTTDAERVFPGRSPWRVADFSAAEIARLDAGSWFSARFAGTRVPTLRQLLEQVAHHRQGLLLELKEPGLYPGIEQDTLRALAKAGWLSEHRLRRRLVVQSFSADSVRTLHRELPDLTTAYLGTPAPDQIRGYAAFTDRINPSHTSISAQYVAAVHTFKGPHGKPMEVHTWTVNTAEAARRVHAWGVDGIISNKPELVRRALNDD